MLGGCTTAGNREQRQVELVRDLEQALEGSLVGEQAGKQRPVPFQVRQLQVCKPVRPAWIQMAPDFDLIRSGITALLCGHFSNSHGV
jgi:hypothetical protein